RTRQDRAAIHQPYRVVAARIAPGDVAIAVAVEVVGVDGHRQAPDLVAGIFDEPQRAVRPHRDVQRIAVDRRNWEYGDGPRGRDPPDLVVLTGEPQRAVRPRRDAVGKAGGRGEREFGDGARGRNPPDLVGVIFGEPHIAVRPHRDANRAAVGRGNQVFVTNNGAVEDTDLIGVMF